MASIKDVEAASSAFLQAHPDIGPDGTGVPLSRRQAREEMQGLPRYPARQACTCVMERCCPVR